MKLKNDVILGASVVLRGSYANGKLSCEQGIFPALLSANMINYLGKNNIDISLPKNLLCLPDTKPSHNFNYNDKDNSQKPYLSFVVESLVKEPPGLVNILGKVFYEIRKFSTHDFVLVGVGTHSLKVNGRLKDSNSDAVNKLFKIVAKIAEDRLVIVDSFLIK